MRKAIALAIAVLASVGMAFGQTKSTQGTLTAQSVNAPCDVAGSCVILSKPADDGTVGIHIDGTFSGTLVFEGVIYKPNWTSIQCFPLGGGASVSSIQIAGDYQCPGAALVGARVRMSVFTSGTANVFIQSALGSIGSGTSAIGSLPGITQGVQPFLTPGQTEPDVQITQHGAVIVNPGVEPFYITPSMPVQVTTSGPKALLLPCNGLRRTNCQ